MKLLIVDDEELTRNGLISSIDWEHFGITEILQADDGLNGLNAAKEHRPDIILCDVRMPRMDGIEMLEQIESFLPNVCAIFMSGFSDKEYLKAAIKLKAISYIEKPIDPVEISDAIAEAADRVQKLSSTETAGFANQNRLYAQLAYCLTVPYASVRESLSGLLQETPSLFSPEDFRYAITLIVRMDEKDRESPDLSAVYASLSAYLESMHLSFIYSERRLYHVVFHIYGHHEPSRSTVALISEKLCGLLQPVCRFYIAIGDTVCGMPNVYNSYTSAVIALQNSFFFYPGAVLYSDTVNTLHTANTLYIEQEVGRYIEMLTENRASDVKQCLDMFKEHLSKSTGILPNQLKGIYYEMFSALYKLRKKHQMNPDFVLENQDNIMDIMDSCFSFDDLHQILIDKTLEYLDGPKDASPENSVIYLIREYIGAHYMEPDLSVKSISEYANLSTSYTCTFFKNETGITLNQYITEFRMKKAKQLLADPRIKINEISSQVGYNDGNYFGKSFRKFSGVSPSEYREQVLNK